MSLNIPDLDDQEYAEIIEDARKRIPTYSKTWTDHNASDPGITVLELLAWLAETYTYQLDRITDAHRLKYLALLGERPRPPRSADVDLRISLPEGVATANVAESTKLVATDEADVSYGFETAAETTLTAAQLDRVVTDGKRGRLDHSNANETPGMRYPAFGEAASRGDKLYLGFDGNPFFGTSTLSLAVRLHEAGLPDPATHGEAADSWTEPVEFEPSVAVEWQHCVDYERWYDEDDNDVWVPLDVEYDGTNEFYRSGYIAIDRPTKWQKEGGELFGEDETYRWIRCVVVEDGHEIAPLLDSVEVNLIPVEHRWTVKDEDGEPLRDPDGNTKSTGLPNQTFTFARSHDDKDARSVELPDRTVVFAQTPVLDVPDVDAPAIDEEEINVGTWERREDFDASGPHSKHYVLDPASGTARFGDGSRGKIPPEGARIITTEYVSGGGTAGNVSPSVTWTFEGPLVQPRDKSGRYLKGDAIEPTVVQPKAATGGTAAESIDEVFGRLIEDRRIPYRAVSLADYEYLTTHTPGLRFGRTAARVVEHDPVRKHRPIRDDSDCRCTSTKKHGQVGKRAPSGLWESTTGRDASERKPNKMKERAAKPEPVDDPGPVEYCEPHREVRVIVLPYSRSSRPTPSEGFIDAVQNHLDRHRLLTDWVTVEPPTYVDIDVGVEVTLESGYAVPKREAAIDDALKTFLHPLQGFEGDGWPFGRTIYRSELYEEVESVRGVDCVTELTIRASHERRTDAEGNVTIDETELPSLKDLTVTAEIDPRETCGRGK